MTEPIAVYDYHDRREAPIMIIIGHKHAGTKPNPTTCVLVGERTMNCIAFEMMINMNLALGLGWGLR